MLNHFQVMDEHGNYWVFPKHAITGVKAYKQNGGYKIEIYLSCEGCKSASYWAKTKLEAEAYIDQLFGIKSVEYN